VSNDSDGDTILDPDENEDFDALNNLQEQSAGTSALSRDTDQDGWSDDAEVNVQSNPLFASSTPAFVGVSSKQIFTTLLTTDRPGFLSTQSEPQLQVTLDSQ